MLIPQDPNYIHQAAERSPLGNFNAPIPNAYYVRSGGADGADERSLVTAKRMFTSVNAACAQMVLDQAANAIQPNTAGRGCTIVCLPGHTETVSAADFWSSLVAGTRIVGWGYGTMRPKFTYSAAAATILLNVADVGIQNCVFEMAGDPLATTALTVAAPITVSAAGCQFRDCHFQVGVDADQIVTKAITGTDAANNLEFHNCTFYGATAAECTTVLEILGSNSLRMFNTHVQAGTSATTVGVMRLNATAALDIVVDGCSFINRKALSVDAVTGVAASAGVVRNTLFGILDTATLAGWTTKADLMFHKCTTVNTTGEAGGETSTVSA